jgi:creatinine amidohydrolase/Fe(II)-dependent formamide hydrolase-like protein
METSMQLFLNPERVRDFRDDHLPQIGREFLDYTTMSVINPMGIWGVPSLGDPKKGEKAIQASIKSILEFVRKAQEVLS